MINEESLEEDAGPAALLGTARLPEAPPPADPDIAGDDPMAVPPARPPADEHPPAAGGGGDGGGVDGDVAAGHESDHEDAWPELLEGADLKFKKGKHDSGWNYHGRLAAQCPNTSHSGCGKSRSTALQTDVFGRKAVLYFLGAWLDAAARMSEREHRAYMPSVADMRAYRDSRA